MTGHIPGRGDIGWIDLNPTKGHEIRKTRPVMVISAKKYNATTGFAFVCPVTNTNRGTALELMLDTGLKTSGVVQIVRMRSVDWRARSWSFIERAPVDLVENAQDLLGAILLES